MTEEADDLKLKQRPSRARYDKVHHNLERRWRRRCEMRGDRMMKEIVDELWGQFEGSPYSWCGFYVLSPDGGQLVLGSHRDKPAGSPLPLEGVCGLAVKTGKTQVAPDGIVVPVFDPKGKAWAVLHVVSEIRDAFDQMDQRWLERLLKVFAEDRPA